MSEPAIVIALAMLTGLVAVGILGVIGALAIGLLSAGTERGKDEDDN